MKPQFAILIDRSRVMLFHVGRLLQSRGYSDPPAGFQYLVIGTRNYNPETRSFERPCPLGPESNQLLCLLLLL
jgi:hypothetical protein